MESIPKYEPILSNNHVNLKVHGIESVRIKTIAQESAKEFEAAFISQMLQYSGLADALTSSGGEDMQSFSQFYLEALAKKISDNGGFGIAEKIYTHIKNKEDSHDELGRM